MPLPVPSTASLREIGGARINGEEEPEEEGRSSSTGSTLPLGILLLFITRALMLVTGIDTGWTLEVSYGHLLPGQSHNIN